MLVTVLRKEISKSAKTLALSNINALAIPKTKCWANVDKRMTSHASEVGKGITKEVRAELGLEVWLGNSCQNRREGEPVHRKRQDTILSTSECAEEIRQLLVPTFQDTLCPFIPSHFCPMQSQWSGPTDFSTSLCGKGAHFDSSRNRTQTWRKRSRKDTCEEILVWYLLWEKTRISLNADLYI